MKKSLLITFFLISFLSCQQDEQETEYTSSSPTLSQVSDSTSYICDDEKCLDSVVLIKSNDGFCEGQMIDSQTAIVPAACVSTCKSISAHDLAGKVSKCVEIDDFYTAENGINLKAITFEQSIGAPAKSREITKTDLMFLNTTISKSDNSYKQHSYSCEITYKSLFHPHAASEKFEELNFKGCDSHGVLHLGDYFAGLITNKDLNNNLSIAINQSCLTGEGNCRRSDSVKDNALLTISKINKNFKDISLETALELNAVMMKSSPNEEVTMFLPLIDISRDSIQISDNVNCFSAKPNFWIRNTSSLNITMNEFGEIVSFDKIQNSKELFLFEAIENQYNPFNGEEVQTVVVPSNAKENILNQTPNFVRIDGLPDNKLKANLVTNTPNIFIRDGKLESIIGLHELGKYNNLSLRTFNTCL